MVNRQFIDNSLINKEGDDRFGTDSIQVLPPSLVRQTKTRTPNYAGDVSANESLIESDISLADDLFAVELPYRQSSQFFTVGLHALAKQAFVDENGFTKLFDESRLCRYFKSVSHECCHIGVANKGWMLSSYAQQGDPVSLIAVALDGGDIDDLRAVIRSLHDDCLDCRRHIGRIIVKALNSTHNYNAAGVALLSMAIELFRCRPLFINEDKNALLKALAYSLVSFTPKSTKLQKEESLATGRKGILTYAANIRTSMIYGIINSDISNNIDLISLFITELLSLGFDFKRMSEPFGSDVSGLNIIHAAINKDDTRLLSALITNIGIDSIYWKTPDNKVSKEYALHVMHDECAAVISAFDTHSEANSIAKEIMAKKSNK